LLEENLNVSFVFGAGGIRLLTPSSVMLLRNAYSGGGIPSSTSGRLAALGVVALLLVGVALLVYVIGGTRYAYLHVAYIPILFGGLLFGTVGSVATAVAAPS
jgi:hypothetical protein